MSARSTRSQRGSSEAGELADVRRLLELERRRYRELFDLAPVGHLVIALEGVVLEANRAACELLTRDPSALVGVRLVDLVAAEWRRELGSLLDEAARGARWQEEFPFLVQGGGSTLLLLYATGPQPGTSASIRVALADAVTVPPSTRNARTSRMDTGSRMDRLSHVLDRLHHVVVTLNSELRVSYANAAAEELLGRREGLAGHVLPDPWPEPSLRDIVANVFEPQAGPAETRATLDGGSRVYEVMALPPDATGEALLVIADVSSVLRRERAEREFVANAAHQLRTPVSAIASAIEVLQGGAKEVPEARDRFLAHLDRECDRLVRLTRSLLLLARAQALTERPAVELLPLCPLLEAIAEELRPAAGVTVRVRCPRDLAALSNKDLLDQALGNLAENAAKFTEEGEIVLLASALDDGAVRIVVSDTGPGAELPSSTDFERFYRDPGSHGDGFGLGLAIASEAVRALRGSLVVEGGTGGTRALVTLPAAGTLKP
jgi:two-component system, OmpR family, phosphate regulon sensor histidine kinase PhoR